MKEVHEIGWCRTCRSALMVILLIMSSMGTISAKTVMRLESQLSVNRAYIGQTVCLTVRLITSDPEISFVSLDSDLIISGVTFVKAESINNNDGILRADEKKGSDTYSAVVYRCLFIPDRSGTVTIPELEFRVGHRRPVMIDHPFFGRMRSSTIEEERITSKALKIKVYSLPEPPVGFSGAIGRFTVSSTVPPGNIYSDGTGIVVYTVSGIGNLQPEMISKMNKATPSGMRIKSESVEESRYVEGDELQNNLEIVCDAVFDSAGEFEIPPVQFIYFDPYVRSYVTVRSNPVKLHVEESSLPSRPRPSHNI